MKSNLLLLFALVVWGKTQANDDCSEYSITDGTLTCFQNFMTNFMIDRDEKNCGELKILENCLSPIIDACVLDEEHRLAVDIELEKIKTQFGYKCSNKALGKPQLDVQCSPKSVKWRATNCYAEVLRLFGQDSDTSFAQMCSELKNAEKCFKSLADDCIPGKYSPLLERQFRILNTRVKIVCSLREEDIEAKDVQDDIEDCLETHKEYINSCTSDNQMRALTHYFGESNLNTNIKKCILYNSISECVTKRAKEECGIVASQKLRRELNEPNESIRKACEAADMKYQY